MLPQRPRVFISYQRTDRDVACRVREHLRVHGLTTWMDQFDIPVGAYWPDEIDRALSSSDTVVGILSPDAVASRNVKNEWDWAIANDRRLVLVQVAPCILSHRYVAINFIDATGPNLNGALTELLHSLGITDINAADARDRVVAASPEHTCLACGARLAETARFCSDCGSPVPAPEVVTAPLAAPRMPTSFVEGRYAVKRLLGEGMTKRVYACHDTVLDRDVAVALFKTDGLDAAGLERVKREAQVLGRLGDHPAIVTIHDVSDDNGQPYLVCELLRGGDLEALLAQTPDHRLPLEQSLRIADQLLQALAHAHRHGIIHRDLRPGNVWITVDGGVKLGDFGLAPAIDTMRRSSSGMFAGTVTYLSPEQALGRAADARSDLYSLGALLYELVTGRPPFQADDQLAVISQHINIAPVAPSWHNPYVPRPLEDLIMQLLAKDPADRPASAADVRQVLAGISVLGGSPYRAGQRDERSAANPLDRVAGGVFVGREYELGQLRRTADAALGGRAGIVLLAGEPGIGKTTLAEETVTYARVRGVQSLWGRCYEWEGAPAYWPWVQIVRGYIDSVDPSRLRAELGAGAADIAQLIPELRERLPELPELPRLDGEQARFRLFDSIARFLRAATTRDPLLLVLDDLHWADTPSLLLLQFVAHELEQARLLIIGTYRDVEIGRRHPLTTTLAELSRGHATQRIAIQGLEAADIGRLIALSAGIEPEPGLVEAVQRETEGNPFFVSEIVRLLVAEGRLGRWTASASWSVSIPESVRDVVGRRLERLSAECNDVLAIASVIGREFTLLVLERASGLPAETLYDALEEAARARLVHEETRDERYRFTHALVQDTLYDEIGRGQRLRLHAAAGQALERVYATDLAPHYGALAYHFGLAAPAGNSATAIDYAVKAGAYAMTQVAWESAIQHYERALHLMELQPEIDPALRCDTLLALGAAQYHLVLDISDSPGGQASYLAAAEIAKSIGSFERLARAALGFAGINVVRVAGGLQQAQLLEDALALAPAEDSATKARVMIRLASDARLIPGSEARRAALSDEALAMARRLNDPAVLAFVLNARFAVLWGPDTVVERTRLAAETRATAEAAGDIYQWIWGFHFGSCCLYELADGEAYRHACDEAVRLARQSRIPYFQWAMEGVNATGRAIIEGRFEDSEASIATLGGDSQSLVAVYFRTLLLFQLRRAQGRLAELDDVLPPVIEITGRRIDPFDRHRGHIAQALRMIWLIETGRVDAARQAFEAFSDGQLPQLPKDAYWLATVALLSEVAVMLTDLERAAILYDLLLPYENSNAIAGSGSLYFGPVAFYLGRIGMLSSHPDNAIRHFETALAINERMQVPPGLAQVRIAFADALLTRGTSDDRSRARELLDQARVGAETLALTHLVVRADELLAATETQEPPRVSRTSRLELSARELDVLRLIVAGNSDREIAETLFISKRTVTTHVSNIFNKLGLSTRAEAAAFAVRNGLV